MDQLQEMPLYFYIIVYACFPLHKVLMQISRFFIHIPQSTVTRNQLHRASSYLEADSH